LTEAKELAAKLPSPPSFYFQKGLPFQLYVIVTLTSILSHSPAGVTRLPESYGEQVKGEEGHTMLSKS
jgi:hypothetical protein